jgi:hypothetical protein
MLIFLSFLELLDFFERHRMDDSRSPRGSRGSWGSTVSSGPRGLWLICVSTFARNTAGPCEHHLRSVASCRLNSQCPFNNRRATRSQSVVLPLLVGRCAAQNAGPIIRLPTTSVQSAGPRLQSTAQSAKRKTLRRRTFVVSAALHSQMVQAQQPRLRLRQD